MAKPSGAAKEPARVDVNAGESNMWRRGGKSATKTFCDGSHQGTSFEPMEYKAEKDRTLFFCQCKATKREPFCDGAHNEL